MSEVWLPPTDLRPNCRAFYLLMWGDKPGQWQAKCRVKCEPLPEETIVWMSDYQTRWNADVRLGDRYLDDSRNEWVLVLTPSAPHSTLYNTGNLLPATMEDVDRLAGAISFNIRQNAKRREEPIDTAGLTTSANGSVTGNLTMADLERTWAEITGRKDSPPVPIWTSDQAELVRRSIREMQEKAMFKANYENNPTPFKALYENNPTPTPPKKIRPIYSDIEPRDIEPRP